MHLSATSEDGDAISPAKGVDLLVDYLDTYYNDHEAWLQLADTYASVNMCARSFPLRHVRQTDRKQRHPQELTALSHAILLQPNDAFALLRHAETSLKLGDYDTSVKEALRVIEMCDGVHAPGVGPSRMAALVARQVSTFRSAQRALSLTRTVLKGSSEAP